LKYYVLSSVHKWQDTFHQGVDIFRKTFWKKRREDGDDVKFLNINCKLERVVRVVKYKLQRLVLYYQGADNLKLCHWVWQIDHHRYQILGTFQEMGQMKLFELFILSPVLWGYINGIQLAKKFELLFDRTFPTHLNVRLKSLDSVFRLFWLAIVQTLSHMSNGKDQKEGALSLLPWGSGWLFLECTPNICYW
jgi:hypothetical protein